MKLRVKTLVYTGATLLILISLMSIFSSIAILSGLNRLEEEQMLKNAKQLSEALKLETARLNTLSADWGRWDESCAFIEGKNPSYLDSNLQDQAIANLGVDIIVFIDNSQKIVYGTAFDPDKKEKIPLPPEILECIEANSSIFKDDGSKDFSRSGILMAQNFPVIFSACSILSSKMEGPSHGTLLFGNYLDKNFIASIGRHIQKDFTITRTDRKMNAEMSEVASMLRKTNFPMVQMSDGNLITVYLPIRDINSKMEMIAQITLRRDLYLGEKGANDVNIQSCDIGGRTLPADSFHPGKGHTLQVQELLHSLRTDKANVRPFAPC